MGFSGKRSTTFLSMLYDFWGPCIDRAQYLYYHRLLLKALKDGGKALELSCGSGHLLLSFVKENMDVSGIEGSVELCKSLRERADKEGVKVNLHQMKLEACEINDKYSCIYLSLGSFQMLSDRGDSEILLSKIFRGLEDGGVLSIALFLPGRDVQFAADNWVIASDKKDKNTKLRYVRREKSHHDATEQVIEGKIRYETWLGRDLLEMDEKDLKLRYYGKYEFISLLKETGFKDIEVCSSYEEDGGSKEGLMLFLAKKQN
jgi:SAM-dependent methyltransferase